MYDTQTSSFVQWALINHKIFELMHKLKSLLVVTAASNCFKVCMSKLFSLLPAWLKFRIDLASEIRVTLLESPVSYTNKWSELFLTMTSFAEY